MCDMLVYISENIMAKVALYARVSTAEQNVEMQVRALKEYCQARHFEVYKEYIDKGISGSKDSRPALNSLMDDARKRKFDAVVVYRFDRFARSSRHLIQALEEFKAMGIGFISYSENIDTSSPLGKAIFVIVGAMAELERNIIVERVKSGLKNAKAKGKKLGRPCNTYQLKDVLTLKQEGRSTRAIAQTLGISNVTVWRALKELLQNPSKTDSINP